MINKAPISLILKRIWICAAILIILAAVFSSLFRSLTPWVKQHKKDVESGLSQLLGQPVTVKTVSTGWYWFHPVLKLDHVTIRDEHNSIHLEKLFVGVNVFKSIIHWRIQPGLLYVDDSHLVLRKKGNTWQMDGIKNTAYHDSSPFETIVQIIPILAQQERLIIRDLSIDFYIEDKKLLGFTDLNLSMVNKSGHYKIKAGARVDQKKPTVFRLLAELNFDPDHYKETNGRIYFSAKKIHLSQWQELLFPLQHYIDAGEGTLALWMDLNHGEVALAQAQLTLKDLFLASHDEKNSIPKFYANMAWKPTNQGWQFNADQIQLDLGNTHWPENQVSIQFDVVHQSHLIFVKSILVDSLAMVLAPYVPQWNQLFTTLKPRGNLSDFQLVLKDKQANYLLSRFDHLSWNHYDKLPAVTNLSGVLQWEPQEGHLELDSENTFIAITNYPEQHLDLLNGVLDWKELSNGVRLSIDRLALSQPELTLSMQGAIDEVSKDSLGTIRLGLEFSAKNLQQWMPYLPKEHMKIKLFNWLNEGIKRIAQASGKITINGAAKDFPFDNNNGEFSIISHAMGGDILITPKWQMMKDLEGYIRLKNRNLEIDIVDGDAQGVPIKQMHLRIDDIGKDKETLLIHSIINGPAQKMLNFVINSPLKEKLAKLKMLALKGAFLLDLHIEVPLYPENDDNLVKGQITLKNNGIRIKHNMVDIPIEDVSGNLSFDETGVKGSTLVGTAFDYPLNIKIQSSKTPQATTLISIIGECTVESLKTKINLPALSLLKGIFAVNALFKITTDPNDLDNLTLTSSLEGLAINVPAPLGKKYKEVAPLEVNVDFNTEKTIRLRTNYNHKVGTDLLFEQNVKKEFALKSGQISLGNNKAFDQKTSGLSVVGSLNGFNLEEWKKVFSRFSENKGSFVLNNLHSFNLKLNKLTFLEQQFDDLTVRGKILPNKDWAVNIKQKKILADLTYNSITNLVSGYVQYLYLNKIKLAKTDNSVSDLKPEQIPNLNLRVDRLSIGNILVGDLTIKSHSTPERWSIDYCRIDSPGYQLMVGGEWVQKNKTNYTDLQFKLHFNNLAKSLELWGLTPAVDAKKGDLNFNGGWNGSINDFSLSGLKGSMYLQLNNGRITHLSPETEEKLGLGKLLSILSLQTIPRRLKLDFSDLSHEGYSFDIFKGNFAVNKGIINTQDSYLDGPVAYASMKGDLNIVRRLYDLSLSISPHITASLPVVATIAGGPIVGLAAWVANKIINQSMQKITAYSYKISGPWDQPVVQQLSIIKKIIKK
ncbi:YhdP family protein [Legionella sp. km772]|uniref:YhdP family protein n=1 Tax=Legionella sp. km772 TaxID=2498111 RepID=UPI000F8E3754|nr:YhdP family protein [Legionella sp. km772]RUR10535.1 TIGR02099 family protein [Legionella sp. km772]